MFQAEKAVGVVESGDRVVNGAGTDNDEQASFGVCVIDDGDDLVPAGDDRLLRFGGLGLVSHGYEGVG